MRTTEANKGIDFIPVSNPDYGKTAPLPTPIIDNLSPENASTKKLDEKADGALSSVVSTTGRQGECVPNPIIRQ